MKIQHDKLTYVDEILFSFFEKWGNLLIFRDIGRKIHYHASSANIKSHGPPLLSKVCAQPEMKLSSNVMQVSSIYCGENKKRGKYTWHL